MIDWSIFEKIYCIHFLPYWERVDFLHSELKRIGLIEQKHFEFYETVPNKYYEYLMLCDNDKHRNDVYNIKYNSSKIKESTTYVDLSAVNYTNIKLTIDSYNLLKICQYYGYEKVLILEDDNRYLNDLGLYNEYLQNIPSGYDIINLDPYVFPLNPKDPDHINHSINIAKENDINGYYYECTYEPTFNCSNIILSKNAVNWIVSNQEVFLKPFDHYTWNIGDSGLKRCNSNLNLSIQNIFKDRQNKYQTVDTKYKFQTIEDSNYASKLENV